MTARACPICTKPAAPEHKPFCSRRCADLDLRLWLTDRYVLPGGEPVEVANGGADED